jgi:hypothetical protein
MREIGKEVAPGFVFNGKNQSMRCINVKKKGWSKENIFAKTTDTNVFVEPSVHVLCMHSLNNPGREADRLLLSFLSKIINDISLTDFTVQYMRS